MTAKGKFRVYLASPMAGCNDVQMRRWRETVKAEYSSKMTFLDPVDNILNPDGPRNILPGCRGCPGRPRDQTGKAGPESARDRSRRRRTWTAQYVSGDRIPEPSRDAR